MGTSSSILIKVDSREKNFTSLIKHFISFGWTFNDNNQITYLPEGDIDDFDWQIMSLEESEKLYSILNAKEMAGELLGVVLTWKDSQIGGNFLLDTLAGDVNVGLSINRKGLAGREEYTDFSWYLEKLIEPIENNNFIIEAVACKDVC
jgi:hypothetical protein